jgi:hypothetical protein
MDRRKTTAPADRVRVALRKGHADAIALSFETNLPGRTDLITVRALDRFGYSGARLYLCFPGEASIPFVVKIDDAARIRREFKATKSVQVHFADIDAYEPVFRDGLGALLYKHKGGATEGQIDRSAELQKLVFGERVRRDGLAVRFRVSAQKLRRIFESLYGSTLELPRNASRPRRFTIDEEYQLALRLTYANPVAESLLGNDVGARRLKYLNTEILNPRAFIEDARHRTIEGAVGPVHGDLHASNVIIDATGGVHLIDFAKASTNGHLLKDYALMECSLRFLVFPHHVNLEEQEQVDRQLLDEDGGTRLRSYSGGSMAQHYQRLGEALDVVRHFARKALGNEKFDQYLLSLYVILYGNLGFPAFNRHVALRALGLIADRLMQSGQRH